MSLKHIKKGDDSVSRDRHHDWWKLSQQLHVRDFVFIRRHAETKKNSLFISRSPATTNYFPSLQKIMMLQKNSNKFIYRLTQKFRTKKKSSWNSKPEVLHTDAQKTRMHSCFQSLIAMGLVIFWQDMSSTSCSATDKWCYYLKIFFGLEPTALSCLF